MRLRAPLLAALLPISTIGCTTAQPAQRTSEVVDSLSVRELNLVDEQGRPRMRLAAPFPDPKGLQRKVKPVGLQFLDAEGNEVGGLVMIDSIGVRGLCFDAAENYEAMCLGLEQGRPTVTLRDDWKERILLTVADGTARITLHDGAGRAKVTLSVDKDGTVRWEGAPATAPTP